MRSQRGQPIQATDLGKNQILRSRNFVPILELCKFWWRNVLSKESLEEKMGRLQQGRGQRSVMTEEGDEAYCSTRTKSCIEATDLPLLVAGTEIYCWCSKKQLWMELIFEDLIKERAVGKIRPLVNRINNYINRIFADKVLRETLWSWLEACTGLGENKIPSHLCCFNKLKIKLT